MDVNPGSSRSGVWELSQGCTAWRYVGLMTLHLDKKPLGSRHAHPCVSQISLDLEFAAGVVLQSTDGTTDHGHSRSLWKSEKWTPKTGAPLIPRICECYLI